MIQGLYQKGYIIYYPEGDSALYRDFPIYKGSVNDVYHTIGEGETLHSIARIYYRTSYSWFIIADANPDIIDDIFDLTVGETILIP